jgi:chromate transport protein ChrA
MFSTLSIFPTTLLVVYIACVYSIFDNRKYVSDMTLFGITIFVVYIAFVITFKFLTSEFHKLFDLKFLIPKITL